MHAPIVFQNDESGNANKYVNNDLATVWRLLSVSGWDFITSREELNAQLSVKQDSRRLARSRSF